MKSPGVFFFFAFSTQYLALRLLPELFSMFFLFIFHPPPPLSFFSRELGKKQHSSDAVHIGGNRHRKDDESHSTSSTHMCLSFFFFSMSSLGSSLVFSGSTQEKQCERIRQCCGVGHTPKLVY